MNKIERSIETFKETFDRSYQKDKRYQLTVHNGILYWYKEVDGHVSMIRHK